MAAQDPRTQKAAQLHNAGFRPRKTLRVINGFDVPHPIGALSKRQRANKSSIRGMRPEGLIGDKLQENRDKVGSVAGLSTPIRGRGFSLMRSRASISSKSPAPSTGRCFAWATCVDIAALGNHRCGCGKDHDGRGHHTQTCDKHAEYSLRHDKLLMDHAALQAAPDESHSQANRADPRD